jgi:Transposase, Mutator family
VVRVGDGALRLWAGLREVFPETREQRCWVHKVANVLNTLPKSVHAGARRALNEIAQAEDRAHAERAIEALVSDYGAKWPKAVAKVVDDQEALLTFFDYRLSTGCTCAPPTRSGCSHWRAGSRDRSATWPVMGGCALTLNSIGAPPGCLRTRGVGPGYRARGGGRPGLKGAWALNPDLPARGLLVSRPAPALQTTGGWRAATRRSGGDRRAQAGV